MKKKPVGALAREVIANVTRYIEEREEVINEAQFKEFTALIDGELARIALPTPEQFDSRRPSWVQIMERVLVEIDAGEFRPPYEFNHVGGDKVLYVRLQALMDHLIPGAWMAMRWPDLTARTPAGLKKELAVAGVLVLDEHGEPAVFERRMGGDHPQLVVCVNLSKMFRAAYFNPIGLPFN